MIRVAKEDSIFSSTRNLTSALSSRVECGNFFWSPRTGQLIKGQVWFWSPNPNFRLTPIKVFIFKKFQGAQIWIFLMKIGMKLPFTLKNKRRYKFELWPLKSTILDPQKVCLWFLKKTSKKNFSSCFSFDSALKTIDAQMFFWLVILKMHKKGIDHQKRFFVRFQKYWSK